MRVIYWSCVLLLGGAAQAGVYKCQSSTGGLTYRDTPCADPSSGELTDIDSAPVRQTQAAGLAPGIYSMSEQHRARVEQSVHDRTVSGRALRRENIRRQQAEDAIRKRDIVKDMTFGEARQSWGPPSEIHRSHSGQQWIYRRRGKHYASIRFDRQGKVVSARRAQR